MSDSKTIWCNAALPADAMTILNDSLAPHRVVISKTASHSNLLSGGIDPELADATIAFGQPDAEQVMESPNIKWVHLTSAGYTRYDNDAFRAAMKARGGILTNSSQVYADPCAEHAAAMVLSLARQLPQALDEQHNDRRWLGDSIRRQSYLLKDQTMLIYGFGSIARRLIELLAPFDLKMIGVRRSAKGDEGVPMVNAEQADAMLQTINHVMNILPASASTDGFFDARRIGLFSRSATFYNIGRGTTVDQSALAQALQEQRIAGAYLDVTDPEPLPPEHPLWRLPNCWITPHTAGGHRGEAARLVQHFRANLERYLKGETLVDRII